MYGIGAVIFWFVCTVIGFVSVFAIGRSLAVRVSIAIGIGLFIVYFLPSFDDPDPMVRWLMAPPLVLLAILALVIILVGTKKAQTTDTPET